MMADVSNKNNKAENSIIIYTTPTIDPPHPPHPLSPPPTPSDLSGEARTNEIAKPRSGRSDGVSEQPSIPVYVS